MDPGYVHVSSSSSSFLIRLEDIMERNKFFKRESTPISSEVCSKHNLPHGHWTILAFSKQTTHIPELYAMKFPLFKCSWNISVYYVRLQSNSLRKFKQHSLTLATWNIVISQVREKIVMLVAYASPLMFHQKVCF